MNKFSVLMCFYAEANPKHFEEAVESILTQSLVPDEFVLVQDGPISKELSQVVAKLDKKIKNLNLVILKKNCGHGKARDAGLQACSNDIVAIMDADDVSRKDRFIKQIELFRSNPSLVVVCSNLAEFINCTDNIVSRKILPQKDEELKKLMRWKCPINQPSVVFKRSAVEGVGGYLDWFNNEDYYLWIRLALKGFQFQNIEEELVYFRITSDVYSRRGGLDYFKSEYGIQKLLLERRIATPFSFIIGVASRFVIQVLMPNSIRSFVYKKLLRKETID